MSFSIADPDSQHFIVHEVVNKRFDLAMFLSWLVKTKHTLLFSHIKEGVWTLHLIKKRVWWEKRKAPTCGHCAEVGQYALSNTEDRSIRHQASCRHLRYIECFLTPITHHRRSYGSTHSTKGALLHPQWKSSVLSDIDDKTYMTFHAPRHYNCAWITR